MVASIHNNAATARLVERQLRNWELAKSQQPQIHKPATEIHDFVTVSQAVGAGGEVIAQRLADMLGWPVFDKQSLLAMALDDVIRARLYASMDERDLNWFERTFRSLEDAQFRKADYFHRLTETVLCLTRQGNAVFLGRAADMILPKGVGLKVRIVAPRKERIARIAGQLHLSENEAAQEISRVEAEQDLWVRRHFHVAADDCSRFDLVLNTGTFLIDQMLQMILEAMRQRGISVREVKAI